MTTRHRMDAEVKKKYCLWIYQDIVEHYETACGWDFELTGADSLKEANFNYCIFCGRKIKEARHAHPA